MRVNFAAYLQSKDDIQQCKPNFWDSCVKLAQGFEAAVVDPAGIESDELEKRDAGRTSRARGVGNGRESGRGRVKQKAVRLQPHEVRRPAPRLVATGATGQLELV